MKKVTLYGTWLCPYCYAAKKLLKQKNVDFLEVRVDKNRDKKAEMIEKSGRFTVPQIFINGTHIGGYDDISELERKGKLDRLLIN